ncbi:MAG: hypothetical protein AAB037_04915, partial [Chloroflexota bacterium]
MGNFLNHRKWAGFLLGALAAVGLAVPPGVAQERGWQRATLTVHWTAKKTSKDTGAFPSTASWRESLEEKIVFDILELFLPGSPTAMAGGGYFTYAPIQQHVGLVSSSGKSSYSGQGRVEGGCGMAVAVRKSAWTEEGSANWDSPEMFSPLMFALAFRGEDPETLTVASKPFEVTKKTTDLCPNAG